MRRVRDPSSYHAMSSYPSGTLCCLGSGAGAADCVVLVVVWVRRCERGGVALCGGRWALGAAGRCSVLSSVLSVVVVLLGRCCCVGAGRGWAVYRPATVSK